MRRDENATGSRGCRRARVLMAAAAIGLAPAALPRAVLLVAQEPAVEREAVPRPVAAPGDVESVDAILLAVYDVISGGAGVPRDWDRMRSLFVPDARLIQIVPSPGYDRPLARFMSVEEWIEGAARHFSESPFWETEVARVEERYGAMAHAFSTYESRAEADGEAFARGINSFQLLWDGDRWWIVNVFWAQERPGTPIPDRYLP
jgi:hypothetical protein